MCVQRDEADSTELTGGGEELECIQEVVAAHGALDDGEAGHCGSSVETSDPVR